MLGVDWNKWVAVRGVVGMGLVIRFESQRVVRRVERGEAVVVVMRLMGGSLLRWCGGNDSPCRTPSDKTGT